MSREVGFSGLLDVDGKKIYEGNTIRAENDGIGFTGAVVFEKAAFRINHVCIASYSYLKVLDS